MILIGRGLNKKRQKQVCLVAVLCLTGAGFYWLWPAPALRDHARELAHSAYNGRADVVLAAVPDVELKAYGIDRVQAARILDKVVLPTIKACRIYKVRGTFEPDPDFQSTILFDVETPRGAKVRLHCSVEATENGACRTLMSWLKEAWYLRYIDRFPDREYNPAASYAWGANADREFLAKNGITRYFSRFDGSAGMSLDDAIGHWQKASGGGNP